MLLGITEDFTTENTILDIQLTAIPQNGLYVNSGTHPVITLRNLLAFLPYVDVTFAAYDVTRSYGVFEKTRSKNDIVTSGGLIYQCIQANIGEPVSDTDFWMLTNMDSLRLRNLLFQVKDRVISELNLQKRLIDNQYLYDVGDNTFNPTGDYFGWAVEPKNSDYVRLTINQMSIHNVAAGAVAVYVVNQGELIDTISVVGGNGAVSFKEIDYSFYGKGVFYFLVEPQQMKRKGSFIDVQRYKGFVAYTVTATGNTWSDLDYTISSTDNGIGLNLTVVLDSQVYVDNNLNYLSKFIRNTFEVVCLEMFLNNANNRSNSDERYNIDRKILITELKDTTTDTVVNRFKHERKRAFELIEKTFDSLLSDNDTRLKVRFRTP
jgi:hypothetical protein